MSATVYLNNVFYIPGNSYQLMTLLTPPTPVHKRVSYSMLIISDHQHQNRTEIKVVNFWFWNS